MGFFDRRRRILQRYQGDAFEPRTLFANVGNKIVGNISVPMEREELDSFVQVWESFLQKVR